MVGIDLWRQVAVHCRVRGPIAGGEHRHAHLDALPRSRRVEQSESGAVGEWGSRRVERSESRIMGELKKFEKTTDSGRTERGRRGSGRTDGLRMDGRAAHGRTGCAWTWDGLGTDGRK